MRKALFLLLIVSTLILSGCIDVYQHIKRNSNGNTDLYIQFTLSKPLMAMASSFSDDEDSFDYNQWLDKDNNLSTFSSNGFPIIEQGKIDTETDFGFFVKTSYNLSQNKNIKGDTNFIPLQSGSKTVFYLNLKSSSEGDSIKENTQIVNALLSSAKYRLTISKTFLKNISKVYLEDDEIIRKISFVDLTDEYLIEIPMIYLLDNNTQLIIE